MAKQITLAPINSLVKSFNETVVELNALMSWASGMNESGLSSSGAQMSKQRLTAIRKLLRDLEVQCKPARRALLDIKDSGHFNRSNPTPLYFQRKQ